MCCVRISEQTATLTGRFLYNRRGVFTARYALNQTSYRSQQSHTNRSAERLPVTLTEAFRDFPQLQGKCQGIRCKVRARPAFPPPGAAASPKHLKKTLHTPSLRLSQSGLRTQTANQAKFSRPIISPGPPRR